MLGISGPALVIAARRAGIMAGLPRHNAASFEQFENWLQRISDALARVTEQDGYTAIGPLAVNLSTAFDRDTLRRELDLYRRYGVEIIISARGDPTELAHRVHDWGGLILHDVTNLRFAEKAVRAGVDGLTCIASGGGGHSGQISAFALIPEVRAMFEGIVIAGGAISSGAGIRAVQVLGADIAYLGTHFIATTEADADIKYKTMIVDARADDIVFSSAINGVGANWLAPSLRAAGLDPTDLARSRERLDLRAIAGNPRPWRDLWSAGQGVAGTHAVEPVRAVVDRLIAEYAAACALPAYSSD